MKVSDHIQSGDAAMVQTGDGGWQVVVVRSAETRTGALRTC